MQKNLLKMNNCNSYSGCFELHVPISNSHDFFEIDETNEQLGAWGLIGRQTTGGWAGRQMWAGRWTDQTMDGQVAGEGIDELTDRHREYKGSNLSTL